MRKSSSFSLPFRDSLHRWNFPTNLSPLHTEHVPLHRSPSRLSNPHAWDRVRRQARGKWPLLWLLVSGICGIWIIAKTSGLHFRASPTACKVDYDHSVTLTFTPVDHEGIGLPSHARYTLHKVHDAAVASSLLSGRPVLFIPGHAGSARQAKALASHLQLRSPYVADLFAVDFSVEFSAFKGHHLYQQASYVAQCVKAILRLYEHRPLPLRPTSVLLVGHSMGGVVARLAVKKLVTTTYEGEHQSPRLALAEESHLALVDTLITLGTPHVTAAWPIDESVFQIYRDMNLFYATHKNDLLRHLVIVSLSGGFADTQVQGELSEIPEELFPAERSFFTYTSSLDQVRMEVGHEDLCRCRPLQESLSALITSLLEQVDLEPPARMRTIRQFLSDTIPRYLGVCAGLTTNRSMEMEVPVRMAADTPVCRRWMSVTSTSDWEVIRGLDVQKSSFPLCIELEKTSRAMEMVLLFSSVSDASRHTLIGLQIDQDNTVKRSEHLPILFLRQSHSLFGQTMTAQSMALLTTSVLQDYDVLLISCDVTLIEYVAVHVRPVASENVVRTDRYSSSYTVKDSLLHRFRFPTLQDKHSMVSVRVTRQGEGSSSASEVRPVVHLIEPLAISSVESISLCETAVRSLSKLGTHDVWTMQLEFHQLSALQSAPSLILLLDPAEHFSIEFDIVTNWRQYFRSYARFLLPITLLLPLCTLLYSLARWVDQQIFYNFYLSMSYLLVFWVIPVWTAFFVVSAVSGYLLHGSSEDLVLESSSWGAFMQRFDASGLLDEDIVLHIPIPLPLSLYYVAIFCATGWILTWTSTPWIVTLLLREVVKQTKKQCFPSESPYHITEGDCTTCRYWPLMSLVAIVLCIYQPIIALVSATFILFCTIIVSSNKDVHMHYQVNVFLLMYMCCVWKFGCLMDVTFQYEGMHPLDREWIVILPIVHLALFSTMWMFPRSLRHGVPQPQWGLFGASLCCMYIVVFSWHYVYTTMHAVSVACSLLDLVLLLDWYQRSTHKATKQM